MHSNLNGGAELAAPLLGSPLPIRTLEHVGIKLYGQRKEGVSLQSLAARIAKLCREHGGASTVYTIFGPGIDDLSIEERIKLVELGRELEGHSLAFPVDSKTLQDLRQDGIEESCVMLTEQIARDQRIWQDENTLPYFATKLELNQAANEPIDPSV